MLNVEAADVDIALIIIDQRNVADVHRRHRFLRKAGVPRRTPKVKASNEVESL